MCAFSIHHPSLANMNRTPTTVPKNPTGSPFAIRFFSGEAFLPAQLKFITVNPGLMNPGSLWGLGYPPHSDNL
jgi:hypothetical protein